MKARLCAFVLMLACVACSPVARDTRTVAEPAGTTTEIALRVPAFTDAKTAAIAVGDTDPVRAEAAVAYLRANRREGLVALRATYADEIAAALGEGPATGRTAASAARILAAIDGASGQRDGWASGLYWHKDLESAKAEAALKGLPILNLWLLGTLDDEFC